MGLATVRRDRCDGRTAIGPACDGAVRPASRRPVAAPAGPTDQSKPIPPDAMISAPTMNADSGALRCSTVDAISSGVPNRPTGTRPLILSAVASSVAASSRACRRAASARAPSHDVHAHAVRQQLRRQRLRERIDGRLARRIHRRAGHPDVRVDRAIDHDRRAAVQQRHQRLDLEIRALHVGVEHEIPHGLVAIGERRELRDARVDEHGVEPRPADAIASASARADATLPASLRIASASAPSVCRAASSVCASHPVMMTRAPSAANALAAI